jgi:hypothetical protein
VVAMQSWMVRVSVSASRAKSDCIVGLELVNG